MRGDDFTKRNPGLPSQKPAFICDLHMHVIPRLDDGPEWMSESVDMLKAAYQQGVLRIFCTSHSWEDKHTRSAYLKKLHTLQSRITGILPGMMLYPGCEIYFDGSHAVETVNRLKDGVLPTMNDTNYILTEFHPAICYEEAESILRVIREQKYIPIIAHAERYEKLNSEHFRHISEEGGLLQINLYSLVEERDAQIRARAEELCKNHLANFVGTDAHGRTYRPPRVFAGVKRLAELCDDEYLNRICFKNALTIIYHQNIMKGNCKWNFQNS